MMEKNIGKQRPLWGTALGQLLKRMDLSQITATFQKMSVKEIMREMKKLKISLEGDKWIVQNRIKSVRETAVKVGYNIPKYVVE